MFKTKGKMYLMRNRHEDGHSKLRIAEVQFLGSGKNFVFEKSSPFVEKIDEVVTSLTEAGILFNYFRVTKNQMIKVASGKKKQWLHANDEVLIKELGMVLILGYASSLAAFTMEVLWKLSEEKYLRKLGW